MTEYYDRQEVNSRHGVYFSEPKIEQLYYYMFDTCSWVKVTPLDRLPYNLCSYRIEEKDDTQVVVTCRDSYRLSNVIPENTDHEEMLRQKKWRDKLVGKGKEFDFLTSNNQWKKGVVCWIKADIIPDVLHIGNRNNPCISFGNDVNGYYYKESNRFAKSCTHTRIITQEELDEEKRQRDLLKQKIIEEDNMVTQLKKSLKMYVIKKYKSAAYGSMCGRVGFIDTLPYYNNLKKCPFEITKQVIVELLEEEKKKRRT